MSTSCNRNSFTLPILDEDNYSLRTVESTKYYSTTIYGKTFEFEGIDVPFEPAVGTVHNKSKTVTLPDGTDFFNATNWYGNDSEDVKAITNDLINESGELVFQNDPKWKKTASLRSTVLNVVKKDDGQTFTHPLDDWDNVNSDSSFATIFGTEFDYDLTIKSNGGFTFMFGGVTGTYRNSLYYTNPKTQNTGKYYYECHDRTERRKQAGTCCNEPD